LETPKNYFDSHVLEPILEEYKAGRLGKVNFSIDLESILEAEGVTERLGVA